MILSVSVRITLSSDPIYPLIAQITQNKKAKGRKQMAGRR
jgi:hypothetical protein